MLSDEGIAGWRSHVEKVVSQLMLLSRSDEACRLLGVEGVLAGQVEITVLDDPLDYLAHDIAVAVHDADGESAPGRAILLSTLVAEMRLCGLIVSRIDQRELVEHVLTHIGELET